MAKLTLSLGSNLGNRRQYLAEARNAIIAEIGPLAFESEIVITPAWGLHDQPDYLNQLLVVLADAPDRDLPGALHHILDLTQEIEQRLGRERKLHWGPRTIDIDLIFYDDVRYEDERLSLPHPWWRARAFVTDLLPAGLVHDGYFGIFDGG